MLYWLVNEESDLIYDLEGWLGWVDGTVGMWIGVLMGWLVLWWGGVWVDRSIVTRVGCWIHTWI